MMHLRGHQDSQAEPSVTEVAVLETGKVVSKTIQLVPKLAHNYSRQSSLSFSLSTSIHLHRA